VQYDELNSVQKKAADVFEVNLKRTTPRGWVMTKRACPFCGKDDYHFGLKFQKPTAQHSNPVSYHCFKCNEKGGVFKLFKELGLLDFLDYGEYVKRDALENKIHIEEEGMDLEVITRHNPFGWRRVTQDPYLEFRGFQDWQYEEYMVGRTKLDRKLKDYVIFLVMENEENKGYVARHVWSKDEIKAYEERTGIKVLRYRNEGGVEFEKLLMGLETLKKGDTVILVEGVFDKTNVDTFIRGTDVKCCCTFGKKISDVQIEKLRRSGIENIVLMYDPDAIDDSKRYGDILSKTFSVKIARLLELSLIHI
jgi:DNA primase